MPCYACGGRELIGTSHRTCPCCGVAEPTSRPFDPAARVKRTPAVVTCPKCGSEQIAANKKGFGLGKAAAGGFLLGPVGLLGGLLGSGKVMVTCLACGHSWAAGAWE